MYTGTCADCNSPGPPVQHHMSIVQMLPQGKDHCHPDGGIRRTLSRSAMPVQSRIEIMAPAGSFESLAAALQGGADSVYFGVGKLNMRSRATANFSEEDLPGNRGPLP